MMVFCSLYRQCVSVFRTDPQKLTEHPQFKKIYNILTLNAYPHKSIKNLKFKFDMKTKRKQQQEQQTTRKLENLELQRNVIYVEIGGKSKRTFYKT